MPYAIKTHAGVRHLLDMADLSQELACLNSLQATKWRVNRRVLEALRNMGGKIDLGKCSPRVKSRARRNRSG